MISESARQRVKEKNVCFFNIFTELMLRLYQLQISVGPMLMLAIGFLLKITLHIFFVCKI